jgi:ribosomal protein RSM22 (predicted rRNA methylase)
MSAALPPELQAAIRKRLERAGGGFRDGAARLAATYRKGGSALADFDAYLATRLPATFAAVTAALTELRNTAPDFAPATLLDVGAGPGTASWAAKEIWTSLQKFSLADASEAFLGIARELASASPRLASATFMTADLVHGDRLPQADLVVAAYTLAELPETVIGTVTRSLWKAANVLAIIEPGTPRGFARIRAARDALLAGHAFIAAPCPHANACPMAAPDWCHFAVRLPRGRAHMHAKQARVPFEDEKFSYVIAMRDAVMPPAARVLAPPHVSKAAVTLKLCTAGGIERRTIARRDGGAYKSARKLVWGGAVQGTRA